MASFLQQLRLLLWKNGLSVIRQPAWSLALLVWPLVIFIILAITRSQFPPKLTDTCYVAPRNLPSAGFFPFLQTLMCNTDSTCTNKSYLTEGQSKSHWYTRHRQRRDAESHSLPTLLHGFPPLAHLQKGGLVHSILKRDASNQELLELWDRMLNSSFQNMPNVTSVMHTFNNTALVDQTMESVWESVNVLKKSICSFSMTAINTSASSQNLFTKGSINFCSSNDTVLEASLLTLNQVLTEMLLSNPTEVLGSIGGTVVVLDMLQQETSVWDFLLGLPDLFLKPKDEEILNVGAGELENLNNTLTFLQRTFPQANISTDVTNPVITKVIGFLNYMSGWKGRDVYFKLSDVMTPSSIVLYSSEVKDLINQIKIPLDQIQVLFSEANFRTFLCNQNINASYCWSWEASQIFEGVNTWKVAEQVLLAWSQTSASADLAFTKEVFGSFLGLVSPSSLDAVLKHSRSQRSSDAQPQSLAEQLIFGLSNSAFDFLQGMPGWEYIQTFMMAGHSSMQVARVAIEVQLPFIDVVLKDAKYVQEAFLSLMQNETFANAWADHAMDSTVQTVAKVLEGHTSCKDLFAPWAWMSTYSSINFQLWGTLVCAGNDTRLEEMLLTSLLPVNKKVQQLVGVVNGTVMYNVTPSILMAEWHSLYTISLQYVTALQKLQTELNEDYFAAWIPGNISIGLSQILLTSVTGIFENMGSPLENSSLWPSIEPYFHMAYWILTYQPNATASPNCTLTPTAFTCQTGFTWETAVPLIHSLISKVSREPASLLRPLQGTVALLQNSYLALLQQVIANGLPGQLLGSEISLKDLLLDLINTVDKEIQLLSNIDFTQQFDTQLLNDIMAALGLGQIENLLSGGSQTTSMHPVIMGILQVLNNGSIQILNKEEGFAVLQAILSQLGAILPPEQQYQLEAGLNKTHDLIRDLEICSALGQDCVADIQNVFDNLGAMLTFGNNITMPTTHLWGNMTLPVALDVLALLLPWNMSLPAEASMEISRKIQYLLEHAYASPIFNISQSLQASNLTISELEQVNSVFHSNWSVSILETLNMAIQIPQCVNTQTAQSPQKPPVTRQAECVLQLIQTASGLLEVIPVANNAQITLKNWLNITAVEYQKLNNMSTSGSGPLALTEEVLITTLSAIRQNLQGLDVENITDITNELNILEDLLKNVFREQYTYHTINSTLMEQGQYAQKVYGEITLWYLNKLGNYTSGSMFAEILHQLKQMTEMQVALINAKADMVTLTMNQIQNLNHVRLPLEGEDLVQVGSTIMTLLQGEMALIKGNLEIQQTYYNSLGSQMNISIPAEIEGQIMTYLTLTREWITNPQVMTALARIFQWEISSVDITTAGKDLELLLQAMAPLLSPEDRAFIAVAEQVSQAVNYTLLLASTDGGLQSENFTEAVISTVRVVLESISNETGALPQDVVNNILGAFKSSLQLILNSNMSYAQAITLTQGTIQMVDAVIHTLLPAEAVVVLVPIKNSILSYLNNISQPAGFDQWNELIMNVLTELQNSLPSNNTAQPIISTIIKVTENLLSSNEGNLTRNWIINQHLTIALDKIFQGNVSSVDLAGAGVNLEQLLQAMAPLLSPEDRAFLDVAEQVSQALTYALQVASTDGGLQSENFTEALINTFRVVLESISNETGALPQDVVNNILDAFNGSLQLILHPKISYAQARTLTQGTIQMVDAVIHTLLPAEVAEVLVPIKNSILSYLNNISQPAGFDQWNELIMNVLTELQNSLPSNNTAQPIISTILKVTENLLSSNESNLTKDWIINQHLTIALDRIFQGNVSSVDLAGAGVNLEQLLQAMAPLLSPEDRAFLDVAEQVSQALTYASHVASTDGGLQSENFTEAVISTVRVVLESISNETGALPQDVVNNILGAFNGSLQLILNSNISYAQASTLTQGTIQMVETVIHTLLPAEAVVVLVPIKNSILSYLNNISQPAGFDQWNELIMNVLTELQNSLPSNNTAQPIISTIIKVTENLLSSNESNLTKDWIINQHLTIALDRIFQGNVSSVDLAGAGVNLDQLLQAMAPLLSPEDRAFLDVAEQVSQALTYASHVASTDGGLQSENFTEAVISTVRVVLESISNETGALPQDVVNNILGAFNGSLQLILNSNMSYAQASTLTQGTIQMVDAVIHTLLPAEAVVVLVPIKNSILSYLNNISQPAGFDQWNELIMNVLTELQNSLPSNNTAQPIISTIIKVTENLLSSNEGNLMKDWIINQHLTIALDKIFQGNVSSVDLAGAGVNLEQLLQAMVPLLSPEDRAFLDVAEQVSQALTYALQVASTDGGLQSENFTEAVISTVRVVLESISNETGALPQDVVNNILGAFNGSLQLILNSNMSYAQASTLTQETIQMVEAAIHTLLPAEAVVVLVPIKNSILSYLNNISQPAGFDQWNELIMNVLTELQNSFPSNNTAQPIISTIIKVTENLLSSNEGNLTRNWIINQHLTIALDKIFQGNVSSVDLAGAGVNLDQLLQAMAPLLSPEDRAFLDVAEQVSQALTYASHVASTDGGLQSENFTEAVISTVRVVLESISNETGALPRDVINNILGAFNGSLQLILNPNIYYMQANHLTQETVQMLGGAIHGLLPAEVAEVLVPMKNSILAYLQTISQSSGPNKLNEVIVNMMRKLQNSLPSNNTAQPIISVILKVTEYLLNSNEEYTNMWHNLGNFSLGSLNEITEQLAVFLGSMSPFMNESAQTVTESVGVLVQILSGSADQLTFDKLEDMLAALFSTFKGTPMWDSLPSVISTIHQAIVNSSHNMQTQTELLYVLQEPMSNLLSAIFHVMNTSNFTSQSFVGGLPQALVSTAEAALQAGLGGQSLNCSYMQQIWQDVRAGAGSEDTVALWCNISLLPVIAALDKPAPDFNMTEMAMNPLWINATAGMMAESLETFYEVILNSTFASNHLTEVLLQYTSMLSNLSVLEITNQTDWNVQLFQMQLYQSLSSIQMALDQIKREAPLMTPYIEAAGKTIEVILQNFYLLQNSTASPQIIMQALEITLTGMNFTKETINYILSGDIFMNPNGSTVDSLIKEVIQQIIGTGLLGDWPTLYGVMQQILYLEDTSGTLWKTVEFFNWLYNTQETGLSFVLEILRKLYEIVRDALTKMPLPCFSETFIDLFGNVLYMLKQIKLTSDLFDPVEQYLSPLKMEIARGQNLQGLVSNTRNARRIAREVQREPVDDFLDLLDIDYQALLKVLSIPPTSTEIMETIHVFFANPDLGVILKGYLKEMTGGTSQEETIDTALNVLSYLTLPSNGQQFLEMFMDIGSEGWRVQDLDKVEKLAESLGRTIDMAMVLSDQPPLNIPQRIEHMAQQLQASVSNIISQDGNSTNTAIQFLTALNSILTENFEESKDISPQVTGILQNIIGSFSSPGSQMSIESYLAAVDQTAEAFTPLLSGEVAVYFNISGQMMQAFALLEAYPGDIEKVMMSTSKISNSLNRVLALLNITTLQNGQYVQEVTHPLILSSAMATHILFNLSMSNYSLSSNAEREMLLTQTFNQMVVVLPTETHMYLFSIQSALFTALSKVSSTAEITSQFPEISQLVTQSLLNSLNITHDPTSTHMTPDGLVYILMTVSNQVSMSLYKGLMLSGSPVQISQAVNSLSEVGSSIYSIMPVEGQPYINITLNLMETISSVLNDTSTFGDVSGAVSQVVSSVNSLLAMVHHVNTNSSSSIISDLERTLKTILMIIQTDQSPLTQTADITQQLLHTIQNFISLGNSSSLESELPKMVLGASSMNIGHLLRINDTNWTDKLPLLLTNLANSLPEDLQYSPLIKSIMRSLANESQENLHLLQQVLNTTFELGSANSVNESSDKILDHLLTKVCALENMATVQLITSFLPLGPRLLCDTVVPTIQAFHVLTTNLVNQSTDIYDLIFQTFVGDPSTYNTEVDWTSILSEIVGFNVSTLKTLNINITSPAEVKVFELLKNVTLFVEDVERYTSFPPRILQALLDYPLPRNNIQIFAWLANLRQCSDPSSLQLDPTGQEIFSTFCNLTHEWYSITVIFLRHVDTKAALFRLVLSKEIQDLVGIMLELVKFLTDIMHKLVPAINKLQEYLTNIGELNLVANQEFHSLVRGKRSTMSSRATFSTIARALCKNGILTLFAIAKVPIVTETDPSVQTDHKREELIEKFKIPQDASPFCMNLYLDMVNTTGGAVAWAFLKPMLLGQVLYSPDTPVTREIMTKSNSTLHQFGDLKLYASEWIESSSYVMQSADILTKTLPILQNSLRNPFVQNFIQTQTGIDVAQMSSTLSQFSNMTVLLEKNKFIMEQITTLSMLMLNLSSCVNFDRYRAFNSTDELDRQAERLAQNRELYASIIFKLPEETSSSLPPNIDYTIRMNIENVMRTDRARNPFWVKDSFISSTKNQRYNRGFVYLQESIERAIIEMQTGKAMDGPAVQMQAFPYPCFYKDEYLNSLSFAFPMALMTCWVLFVAHFVKKLVHERELRLHEYMKMMGVNPISHFFAWLIESAVFLLVTVIILTIILKAGGILPHSDGFVLFLYLSDYGFSVLAISFLVSSFFDKTNIAGLSGSLIYVICFFPFIVLIHLEDNLSFSLKSALSLFSPTCFSYASQYISRYEKQEEGIQWSNMYISPLAGDTSSFGWLCWLLLIDSVVYFIIGIYIRMVFPGKYGIGLPWYFPVTRSFWKDMFSCCSRTPQKIGRGLLFTNMMQEQNSTNKGKGKSSLAENGEDDFSGLPVGVSLYGLTKTYDNRHAVDNLNLSFYEGHVTSLLGHNGAGKTTTMSLLTGLFAPTSGTIEVYGMDMQTSIDDVRKEMGVCMQYDVLFDHLTTKEHLLLYAQIKAPHLTKQEVNEQVRRILMETDMHSHRHKRVGTLSGGMKRKLSISIAFIGGSRLVVLDEPTTGVDPCSRRSIWDIVLQHKQERTIILSTHHLDEAEVLSDRIAFLERGGLKCCGSPFYLKDKLAKGYNLTLTKKVQTPDSNEKLNIEELRAFIQSYLPDAQQKEGEVGDLVFALPPYTPQNAAAYHSLLTGLDQNLDKLQLGCYGISDTTLEEVFLQLTRDNMEPTESETWSVSESVIANDMFASRDSIPDDLNNTYLGDKASLTGTSNVRGLALTAQRVKAMLLKRVHHSRRDWKGLFSQVLLPVLFVIAAMGLGSIKSDLQHFPKIVLSPALYHIDDQYTFFSNQNPAASGLIDSMMSYPGVDHVCVRDPTDSVCKERPTVGSETWISRGNSSATFTTCKCSNQVQSCPALVYDPPHKRNPSSQIVYNLTGINTEDYLLVTANDFIRNRYGGWDFGKSLPIDLKMDMLDVPENRTLSKVWYNPEGHHTMPAYLNSLNNFILRSSLPPEKRQKYTISISSHPYPGQVQDEDVMVGGLVSILVALCVLTGYSIMTASFVIYEVHEHHTGSKRLQQISGISEPFYWIINFFYDMTLYMIPVVLSVAMIAAFQLPAFTERQNLGAVTLLLVLFGFSTFPWMYLLSAVFKDTEMAFIGYVCINLFISVNTIISTSILYFLGQLNQNDQSIQDVYRTMSNIFLVFPQFSFGNGLMELARVDMQVQILSAFGVDAYKNPFNLDVLGWMFISMFLQGVICFTLRLLLNKTLLRKVRCWKKNVFQSYSPNEDEDVLAERLRVDRGDASADILQVNRLTKVYQSLNKRVQAVKSLSVGIPAGECFGLLGVNGAGKTTTFKMLTGDVSPTDGSAKIRDIDGRMVDIIDCRREGINIGYCPQVDALDDLLTGEEHLYFYARIRGISKREIDRVVNYLLKKLELDYHRHNTSESYSCGTRRKLSTALALIGNPQILLLDEPSSGMDPRSKRHLWKIISEQVMGKCAVVLTSHSMEECEALCTRLAIMVKGQFRCLGSLQHIKNRFGKGFTVKMYLAGASCDVDMISNFMQQNFPSTFLKDHHSNMVEYHVPVAPGGVASIFGLLESNKAVLQIKHFSVSQTTLDEVFINFAMAKTDTDEQEATEGTDIDSLDSYNALDR
ncbi:uncharacterized protein abca12 isoform X6 [Carassius gibelio]|uniref:uncharacterized protein abca12 isoform X3 n=1 Tax=Carassius gibelio TaxID=101364 RepID=UPI0022774E40|nr:uncharacterized protein abca12 isoform X3 [Carassius gibelio]XP_052462829.1 uncharacterized protein abca12 isoform X6 [Carassius gibelio]